MYLAKYNMAEKVFPIALLITIINLDYSANVCFYTSVECHDFFLNGSKNNGKKTYIRFNAFIVTFKNNIWNNCKKKSFHIK